MCEVSIIIVNWNGRHFLQDCLESVKKQDVTDFEVILVDNGSHDDSVEYVRSEHPWVRLISLSQNLGFTGGNHAGYNVARGAFIALLNNDTRVDPSWLSSLLNTMRSQDRIGICASRIVIDGTNLVDSVGDMFTTSFTGTKIGWQQPADHFDKPHIAHGGCAAAILYRRCMLEQIGFLDDDFFFNHEDTDLNMRAWLAGWKCIYVPDAIVYHKVSGSIGHLSASTVYYFSRNNEWVWLKNVPSNLVLRLIPARVVYEIFSFLYYGVFSRQIGSYLRGKIDAVKNVRSILAKRKGVQRLVTLPRNEILQSLQPITVYLLERLRNYRT